MNGVWFWRDALRSDAEALGCSPCDMNRTGRLVPFSQKQPRSKGPKGASDGAQKPGGAGRPFKSQSVKGDAAAPRVLTVTIKRNAGVVKRVRTVVGRATVVRLSSASNRAFSPPMSRFLQCPGRRKGGTRAHLHRGPSAPKPGGPLSGTGGRRQMGPRHVCAGRGEKGGQPKGSSPAWHEIVRGKRA